VSTRCASVAAGALWSRIPRRAPSPPAGAGRQDARLAHRPGAETHCAMNTPTDPVVALVAERFRLEEEAEAKFLALNECAILTLASERIARLDDQIAATVATSPAGLISQVRVLLELDIGNYSDYDFDHDHTCPARLTDTIVAGIERLAGGRPIAAPFLRSIDSRSA
jgi:hypothetical protein